MKLWNGYLKSVPERLVSGAISVLSLSDSKLDYQQRLTKTQGNEWSSIWPLRRVGGGIFGRVTAYELAELE